MSILFHRLSGLNQIRLLSPRRLPQKLFIARKPSYHHTCCMVSPTLSNPQGSLRHNQSRTLPRHFSPRKMEVKKTVYDVLLRRSEKKVLRQHCQWIYNFTQSAPYFLHGQYRPHSKKQSCPTTASPLLSIETPNTSSCGAFYVIEVCPGKHT